MNEEGRGPRVVYVPPPPPEEEDSIFAHYQTGINFDKYDEILVDVSGSNPPQAILTFEEAGLCETLSRNVSKSGYVKPTPVQKHGIPAAAFLLPILQQLMADGVAASRFSEVQEPEAIIVAPTRELINQIYLEARKFAYGTCVRPVVVYGGISTGHTIREVLKGCNVLCGTPGRLLDIIARGKVGLSKVRYLVLDEADRMLDMGFEPDMRRLVESSGMPSKEERQTLMFSATYPEDIQSDREQREREQALGDFRTGKCPVLVATSVAARGLDIEHVQHVVNFDLPSSIDEYVHRIGRTGRCGNTGRAVSFFDPQTDTPLARSLVKVLSGCFSPQIHHHFHSMYNLDITCILWLSSFVMVKFQGFYSNIGVHPVLKDKRTANRNSRQEITVHGNELKPCNGTDHLCVTDSSDCIANPSVHQDKVKNVSCFFQLSDESVTCSWNPLKNVHGDIKYTLIFSEAGKIDHCPYIFSPASKFNVTVKATDIMEKTESLSDPYTMDFLTTVKPSRPNITSISMTENSMHVMWTTGMSKFNVKCKIRYKLVTTDQWTEILDNAPVVNSGMYMIEGLQSVRNYSVAVSCIGVYGCIHWSDWSTEKLGRTLERAPSKALDVCQRIEALNSEGSRKLWLMWKPLDHSDAHGTILGYHVLYMPADNPTLRGTVNTTDLKTSLILTDKEYKVMVMAYNSAGGSPYAHLKVPSGLQHDLPSVKRVWASLQGNKLWVQWEAGNAPVPVSEFAIEWVADGDPLGSHWQRVGHTTYKTVLQGNIQPLKHYNVTVYPIYNTVCGPPKSVRAILEDEEAGGTGILHIVKLTKYTVTVRWEWQRKRPSDSFLRYIVTLTHIGETQSLSVSSYEQEHTFYRLRSNTEYSFSVTGETITGNSTSASFAFTTLLFGDEDIVTAVIPIALLILLVVVLIVLSRTV
ncbi:hypothetical protein MATL_G00066900 [Megalops atlanticus]|uniref:RNA helicase n=1 Tax=Megalops atlanticus TaxID=7932 RepID=A0A9D3QDJ9_MEGAT|nr:hypothetical protein MATL_G00066900 [Megalops atlanticus]